MDPKMSVWHVAQDQQMGDSEQSEMDDGLKETQNLR